MDERTLKRYYKMARTVSKRLYIPGYELEDKIQECVLHAWSKLGDDPPERLNSYIWKLMRNRLISISRKVYLDNHFLVPSVVDTETPIATTVVVPIPFSEKGKTITLAMIDCDGSLSRACKTIGVTYWVGAKMWQAAKREIRQEGFEASKVHSEFCWLCGDTSWTEMRS